MAAELWVGVGIMKDSPGKEHGTYCVVEEERIFETGAHHFAPHCVLITLNNK